SRNHDASRVHQIKLSSSCWENLNIPQPPTADPAKILNYLRKSRVHFEIDQIEFVVVVELRIDCDIHALHLDHLGGSLASRIGSTPIWVICLWKRSITSRSRS